MGTRISWEILLPPFFELMGNQKTLRFSTSQEILLSVLLLRIKRSLRNERKIFFIEKLINYLMRIKLTKND